MADRSDAPETPDVELIAQLLESYQQAHRDQDWDAVRACHDQKYFRWFGCASPDFMDWTPHLLLDQDQMQTWGETRMPEGANYEQQHEVLKTEVRGDMAITVLRDKGCWRSDTGEIYSKWDGHTVWYTGRIDGHWKIMAAFFPDLGPFKSDTE